MQEVTFLLKCNSGGPQPWFLTLNRFMREMAGPALVVMRLLLLTFIQSGLDGKVSLEFLGGTYDISFPYGQNGACYDAWYFSAKKGGGTITIVRNGEIEVSKPEVDISTSPLPKEDQTEEDVEHHRCQESSASIAGPDIILRPGEKVSLQCVLLRYVQKRDCLTTQQQRITLTWVDEAGVHIHEDSQHQINRRSPCDVTLTLASSGPANKTFSCQVTVDGQHQTSPYFWVRVLDPRGKGRGLIVDPQPEHQGHSQSTIGAAVGVVGCAVLTALIAAFAVRRRRLNQQLPDESSNVINNNCEVNEDEVIYADIILPIPSDGLQIQEFESTDYACIRHG